MNTDGTTEPIIAIIGHPIAGNPSQLAIERSLLSLGMEWRVLSFDVRPQDVAKALDGFAVTGIAGVMIAPTLRRAAGEWFAKYDRQVSPKTDQADDSGNETDSDQPDDPPDDPPSVAGNVSNEPLTEIDCLSRGDDLRFRGSCQARDFLVTLLKNCPDPSTLWIGSLPKPEDQRLWPDGWKLFTDAMTRPRTDPDEPVSEIADKDLIVVSDPNVTTLEQWCKNDGSTVAIVLGDREDWVLGLDALGYRVLGEDDLKVGILLGCIDRWTHRCAAVEPIAEAIEEYFGV
jgi:hypothetical protein